MKAKGIVLAIQVALAAIGAWLIVILGGWDQAMKILTFFIAADILTGWVKAIVLKKLSSEVSFRGGVKKLFIYVLVGVGTQLDLLMHTTIVRNAVVTFYCASEALSIVENSAAAGLPIPEFLRQVLEQLSPKKFPPPD